MARAMVMSVGGTPQPLIVTLSEVKPLFVCFLASHQSVDQVAEIKQKAEISLRDEKVLVDDPEDLVACYRAALACVDRVRAQGFHLEETLIDYTGGTKVMSAALVMAAGAQNVRFSYVGGGKRTKRGLGTVESGTERRRVDQNPWQLFAVEEKRRSAQYFNSHQYTAAATALYELFPRLPAPDRLLLEALAEAAQAYAAWDRFDHDAALGLLPPARRKLSERCQAAAAREYDDFLQVMEENVAALGELKQQPSALAGDLVANADRRIGEGKFDDAVARLYRAVELLGQCAFQEAVGVPTGAVPTDKLPASLRAEFARRYADDGTTAKLPLSATYRVLEELGDAAGRNFSSARADLMKILDARNQSILAHGTRPIRERTALSLREIIVGFLPQKMRLPQFPTLPW